jgi:ABC-type transport system involved in multi-copper enzyme maturation permease subunit
LPSRDGSATALLLSAQFRKEWRELTSGYAFWALLLLLSFLAGHSFLQAVELYGEASRSAARSPELAASLSPLDGIWVPTFGALYLATTFLFPFLGLRLVGGEKQTGASKVQLQLPLAPWTLAGVKAAALMTAWLVTAAPFVAAVVIWRAWGGHVFLPEIGTVLLGHLLYAATIGGIAFLLSAVSESPATAGIGTLAIVMASFVLDFAGVTTTGFWKAVAGFSLTANVRVFERGILDVRLAVRFVVLAATLLLLSSIWLSTGRALRRRALESVAVVLGALAVTVAVMALPPASRDVSEDRRNSFNPADERALREMKEPLTITMFLAPEDSRLQEFEGNVLAKLRRTVPHLVTRYEDPGSAGRYGAGTDDRYGVIAYAYGGARDESRSTSPREILPILHKLARQDVVPDPVPAYAGYPLVAPGPSVPTVLFYVVLPALVLAGWWLERSRPARLRRRLSR